MENIEITAFNKTNRIHILDSLRGAAIIFVIVYHILYDLNSVFDVPVSFFSSKAMDVIHFIFLAILIAVSGISTSFSHNIFKRGAAIYLLGMLITLITSIFTPDRAIVFGILSFFGLSMLVYGTAKPALDRANWLLLFVIWILLYIIFRDFDSTNSIHLFFQRIQITSLLNENKYLYPLGIQTKDFHSIDYFPMIPWSFIFLAGTTISKPIISRKFPQWFYEFKMPILDFLGEHTLILYIAHQPIIYAILWAILKSYK